VILRAGWRADGRAAFDGIVAHANVAEKTPYLYFLSKRKPIIPMVHGRIFEQRMR
jgi:hypothetical protein